MGLKENPVEEEGAGVAGGDDTGSHYLLALLSGIGWRCLKDRNGATAVVEVSDQKAALGRPSSTPHPVIDHDLSVFFGKR
jgi:hypothetical protein